MENFNERLAAAITEATRFESQMTQEERTKVTFHDARVSVATRIYEKYKTPTGPLTWSDVLDLADWDQIEVTVINPLRKEEYYKKGRLTGFKSGLFGGGHSKFKDGMPHSYDSSKRHWLRKPKVQVTYNIFEFHGREHSDWIDCDNVTFEFLPKPEVPNGQATGY